MKIRWLKEPFEGCPIGWTLCTSPKEFIKAQRQAKTPHGEMDAWCAEGIFVGVTHFFPSAIIVCAPLGASYDVLVHEAVHVFQRMMQSIGETNPGVEVQAYAIQHLARCLIEEMNYRQQKVEAKEKTK